MAFLFKEQFYISKFIDLLEVLLMEMLSSIWTFIQDQILGMKWLNAVIEKGLSVIGVDTGSRVGGSVQFFIYDVVKITVFRNPDVC